ncbi:hypothetical protein PoB_001191300 [Plakobranchus ocellatus]|uniref:Uncharacterized protein n=1 Tax=Plakobranchus ocellatus TaxID=259542 RepID=A0AAV3YSR1_9GAST|nr:hypothetical protein PoB_001191300 [Plakobranchus ocellatus]
MEAVETLREKKLTRDTAQALYWTCHCLPDISVYLLNTDMPFQHPYVAPGFFQQVNIEQHFAHFSRMANGCWLQLFCNCNRKCSKSNPCY